jgi:hypothetical protein
MELERVLLHLSAGRRVLVSKGADGLLAEILTNFVHHEDSKAMDIGQIELVLHDIRDVPLNDFN